MRRTIAVAVMGLSLSSAGIGGPIVSMPGPQDVEGKQSRRQVWLVPSTDPGQLMRTTVLRPPGDGPFPLLIMNHGTTMSAPQRADFPMLEFEAAALWFVNQGFVVAAPQRTGHGETGGLFFESQRLCEVAHFRAAGLAAAGNILATINYMLTQPFVQQSTVVVLGQSAGGWSSLALASLNPPMVRAVIDFVGGRGGHFEGKPNNNCQPDHLVEAAGKFGSTARIPTLWIYLENDTFFGPALSKRMVAAWRAAGGAAEYHLLPSFGGDGHFFIHHPDAVPIWAPIVQEFLARHP
jgi:dienelactone hydrolase